MAFDSYGAGKKEGNSENTVDYEEINRYVIEAAGLQEREVLVGYISVIADLGTQEQGDAEVTFVGDEDAEAEATAANPNTYFKDGVDPTSKKKVRLKCWPQKPIQSIAIAVDFPDVEIDKGQYFGESKPLPLRLWLGGQFYIPDAGMVVGRPIPLKIVKDEKNRWSFKANHTLYKMAVGAKVIKPGDVFLPQNIDDLLGKAFQFEAQVFMKENKGKEYYTEYVKFSSGLGRGQVEPELLTTPYLVQFNQTNDLAALKELRSHVVNTIKRAENYEGSAIQKQLEEARKRPVEQEDDASDSKQEDVPVVAAKPSRKAPAKKPAASASMGDFDSDIPFSPFEKGMI